MIRIGIDGKSLLPPVAGVGRYTQGLLAGMQGILPEDMTVSVVMPQQRRRTVPWVLWKLQRETGQGYDVFHFPFYYPSLFPRCPVTVAIHDVLVLTHPEWFPSPRPNPLRMLIPRGARRAAAIVAPAHCIAADISEICKVPLAKIRVIPDAANPLLFFPPERSVVLGSLRKLGISGQFLLQLGATEPRRGFDLSYAACRALRALGHDFDLVVVGENRHPVAELRDPPPWLRRLGRVNDQDLAALYAGATVVLAASRGEGFDLPVLEALACGAVVVASDIPVHVEHFAPAVELFPSGDGDGLTNALLRVIEDHRRRRSLQEQAPVHAGRFRWIDCAKAHLDLWREVAGR